MIDIHAHILPGVDDGAKTMEESLEMIRQAHDTGIEIICATPHVLNGITPTFQEKVNRTFRILHSQITRRKLNVKLMLGSEIYLREDMRYLSGFSFFSLNQTGKYVLTELPLGPLPPNLDRLVYDLLLEGITPIIAHPERTITEEKRLLKMRRLIHLGALIQINAGSLLGHFGKKPKQAAEHLLKEGLAHVMASDAHDSFRRSVMALRQSYEKVRRLVGDQQAEAMFVLNPSKILRGKCLGEDDEEPAVGERIGEMEVVAARNQDPI
jgi:protein-tyrosine phosphatase